MLCAPFCNALPTTLFWTSYRKLGWVEGTTIVIERKDPDYSLDQLPALAADLVRSKPNLIVAFTINALQSGHDEIASGTA